MSWKFHPSDYPFVQLVAIFIAFALIQPGGAIQCFVCDSSVNPGCTNLKSNSSIVPETCTLEKMKTLNTWLFELNEIAYFKSDVNNIPPMNCQKVVARQTPDGELITARFCQLDTRDTNACTILKEKLESSTDNGNRREKRSTLQHCSICTKERCNGSGRLEMTSIGGILLATAFALVFSCN